MAKSPPPDDDVPVGAAALATKPKKPPRSQTIAEGRRQAEKLIAEAKTIAPDERRCTGKVKLRPDMGRRVAPDNPYLLNPDGTVQSRPCRNRPIAGGKVCWKHGGKAPQVRKRAEKRLLALVEPSLIRLEALVQQGEHMPTALGAVRTVLERAGNAAIGALAAKAEADNRPIIQIGIQVGGIAPRSDVTVGLVPKPLHERTEDAVQVTKNAYDAEVIALEDAGGNGAE